MQYNYKIENTFSISYKFTKAMSNNRYCYYDKITDYKKYAKNTFKRNSRNTGITHDNKIFNDKITNYKIYRKQCEK